LERRFLSALFDEGLVVPWVKLVDADDDEEATALARSIQPSKRCEVWDHHRLIAVVR
jgi:hypothetical protein